MDDNIILIKSSKIIDRLRVLNPNVEEIIECILKKVGVQSRNVYVMLENASINSIASHNLRYTNSIFVIDIEKNRKNRKIVRTYSMPGYFAEKENEIYIRYGTLFNLCGECLSAKRIISCSLGNDIKEIYNEIGVDDLKKDIDEIITYEGEEKMIDDDRTIERTSLCMVSEYNGQVWLDRLADIDNKNRIVTFYYDEDAPKVFDNRNRLFWKNGPDESGFVGVWSWTATPRNTDYERDYIESTYMPQCEPIELIIFPEEYDLQFVIDRIKTGHILQATPTKVFFCTRIGKGKYTGVLCNTKDLVKDGEMYRISENVISLPQYTVSSADIFRAQDRVFYKEFSMGEPEKKVVIQEINEIIREAFLRRASWSSMKQRGLNKNEWKQFKGFLSGLSGASLYQEIAELCECSEEIAKQYITDFILNANKFIEGQDVDSQLLEAIVENSDGLKKRCEEIVSQRWTHEHQREINQAKEEFQIVQNQMKFELDEIIRKKETIEKEVFDKKEVLDEIESNIEKSNNKLCELENEIEQYEALGNEVKEKVSKRIEDAKRNVADFICDMAFCTSTSTVQPIGITDKSVFSTVYTTGNVSQNELEVTTTWRDLIDILAEELREAGIADDLSVDFAIFLYAANKNNMPILLAGPCGTNIANAFSMALYGKTAGILDCNEEYSSKEIEKMTNSEDEIVILKNPFSASWVNCIAELLLPAAKQYFLVVPYAEDLVIEPNGILNYMLPVLTEMFVDKLPTNQFVGGQMAETFRHFVQKNVKTNSYIRAFKELRVNRMTAERWQDIIDMYHGMSGKDSPDMDYLMFLFPCAYITEQGEWLMEYMEKAKNLSSTMKNNIKGFLGES